MFPDRCCADYKLPDASVRLFEKKKKKKKKERLDLLTRTVTTVVARSRTLPCSGCDGIVEFIVQRERCEDERVI